MKGRDTVFSQVRPSDRAMWGKAAVSPHQDEGLTVAISRMNHAVLYVRDATAHQRFYRDVLGFETMIEHEAGAFVFMRAPAAASETGNHHDIAFFTIGPEAEASTAGQRSVGLYHLAWEVPTLEELAEMEQRLESVGALIGKSDHGVNKSLYARDPDGLEFEVMWLVPAEHWDGAEHQAIIEPLDIEQERQRFAGCESALRPRPHRSGPGTAVDDPHGPVGSARS